MNQTGVVSTGTPLQALTKSEFGADITYQCTISGQYEEFRRVAEAAWPVKVWDGRFRGRRFAPRMAQKYILIFAILYS